MGRGFSRRCMVDASMSRRLPLCPLKNRRTFTLWTRSLMWEKGSEPWHGCAPWVPTRTWDTMVNAHASGIVTVPERVNPLWRTSNTTSKRCNPRGGDRRHQRGPRGQGIRLCTVTGSVSSRQDTLPDHCWLHRTFRHALIGLFSVLTSTIRIRPQETERFSRGRELSSSAERRVCFSFLNQRSR
jgi:hypothetical protein